MNIVTLLGRIGKEPEIRYSQSGMAVCNVSLATSEKIKGEEKTQWHRLVAFDKTAELIGKHIHKGDRLAIEGKISYGSYEKDSNTIYTTDIIVNRIHFVGGKSDGKQGNQQGNQSRPQAPSQQYQAPAQQQIPDDDIPF